MINFPDEKTKEVYHYLLNFINENNFPPKIKQIAEHLNYNNRTVSLKLEWLNKNNFIIWKREGLTTIHIKSD